MSAFEPKDIFRPRTGSTAPTGAGVMRSPAEGRQDKEKLPADRQPADRGLAADKSNVTKQVKTPSTLAQTASSKLTEVPGKQGDVQVGKPDVRQTASHVPAENQQTHNPQEAYQAARTAAGEFAKQILKQGTPANTTPATPKNPLRAALDRSVPNAQRFVAKMPSPTSTTDASPQLAKATPPKAAAPSGEVAATEPHSGVEQQVAQKAPAPFVEKPRAKNEERAALKTDAEAAKGLKAVEGGVGIAGIGRATQEFGGGSSGSEFGDPNSGGLAGYVGVVAFHPIVLDGTADFPETQALLASLSLLNLETGGTALERTQASIELRMTNQEEAALSARIGGNAFTGQIANGSRGSVYGRGRMIG